MATVEMDSAAKARYDIIAENLAEVINPELIEQVLAEGRNPRVYWGNFGPFPPLLSKERTKGLI
jgi:hypothetical protein